MGTEKFVTTADYDSSTKGRIRNWWRDTSSENTWLGLTTSIAGDIIKRPMLCLSLALLVGTVVVTGSWWLGLVLSATLYLSWVGRHLAGLLVGAPRRRSTGEILSAVSMFARSRHAWRVACLAKGVKQPGRGGSTPALYGWDKTHAGVSALVDIGLYSITVGELASITDHVTAAGVGSHLGRAIVKLDPWLEDSPLYTPPARSVTVMEDYAAGVGKVYFSYLDPLEDIVPITALVRAPAPLLSIGPTEHSDPAFIHRGMHIMCAGLTGSGKSNFIWTQIASCLYDGEPFQVWAIDPVGGVEMYELGKAKANGSPFVKEYAVKDDEIRALVQKLFNEFERRQRLIAGKDRQITVSEEFPRIYLFIDDYINARRPLLSKVTSKGPTYESLLIQLLTGSRRFAITVEIMTHIPFGHTVGEQIRSLFPQHVAFRLNDQMSTVSMFGPQAELLGAKASRIKMTTPGIGYVAMDQWPQPIRFRNPLITKEMVSLLAQGLLPDGLVLAEVDTPELATIPLAQWQNREHVIYQYDAPPEGIEHNGKLYTGCLYVGISVDGLRRHDEHLSNPEKELLHQVDVNCHNVHRLDAENCIDQIAAGRTVKQVAEEIEAEMIGRLQPELNIAHNGNRRKRNRTKELTR